MFMFVANCSRQKQIVNYRLPENPSPKSQEVPMGGQVRLGGDLTTPQFAAVVEQLSRYGMTDVDRLSDGNGMVIPLVYSRTPIPASTMRTVMQHNADILTSMGKEIRKRAAIATAETINEHMDGLQELKMSVEEESQGSFTDRDPLTEGLRVVRNEAPTPEPKAPRRRKAA